MKEKVYVDRLFADYDDTPEIRDFKEEITVNLVERIKELVAKGLDEDNAFDKATAELGDITVIADDAGKKKRNEAIGQMYMNVKVPITKRTAAGLTTATGLLLLAIGLALLILFSGTVTVILYCISALLFSLACGLYLYFGLTQETAAHYAMNKGRALLYGIVCLIALSGIGVAVVLFLFSGIEMFAAIGISVAFILPVACVLVFLLVTEPKRHKPWLKTMIEREIENTMRFHHDMVDPVKAARFGVASGGLWIMAIAVFLTLGFLIGWKYSWLVFPFALAIQIFMTTSIFEKKK